MTRDQTLAHLRAADEVAREAARHGHHPFGCVLVGPDNRILMRQGNIDTVRHAEAELCRRAAAAYSADFLWTCTLVSTGEPCAMCTGTLYWANIGRLVYGYEEAKLLAETYYEVTKAYAKGLAHRDTQHTKTRNHTHHGSRLSFIAPLPPRETR